MRYFPEGFTLTRKGVERDSSSKRVSGSGTPARPARATRWMIALVEPPIAMSPRIALSKAFAVRISEGRGPPACASSTGRRPLSSSIAMRFRNIIAVGFIKTSPSEMVGNSRGKPPALHTPRLTASATCLRCALQLVSSDHELAMPITGRPSKTRSLNPSVLSHERWTKPSRSLRPNQLRLLSGCAVMGTLRGTDYRVRTEAERAALRPPTAPTVLGDPATKEIRMRLAGKVAVVTGGGSGIGRGILLAMAREGADIAIPDIQVLNAEKVAGEVRALGRKVVAMKADVTSSADVKAMIDRTRETLGKIDILVNNAGAGSTPGMPFTNNTEEDWDRAFAVNTKSVFLTCKAT